MKDGKKKKYLVTGGAGFIGSNFIRHLFNKYGNSITVINLDKLTYAGNPGNLVDISEKFEENYIFIRGDICDDKVVNSIFSDYSPDIVVNFAAESHVDRSISSPDAFIKTNIYGTFKLLDYFKKHYYANDIWIQNKLFIQISTDEVYGDAMHSNGFSEDSPLTPSSPYAASKASADLLALSYVKTYKIPLIITRSSNNFGPYQYPEKFIPLIINNCMEKKTIPLYGEGKNIRDWLYVDDNVSGIDQVINSGNLGEIYNIGGGNEISNIDLAKKIITIINELTDTTVNDTLIKSVRDRKGHDFRYALQTNKIESELGWQPKINFNDALRKTVLWYINNKSWLKSVLTKEYNYYYKDRYGEL